MKTKTKIIGLALAAAMLVGGSILGTMAYLTSTDKVTNTFTVGKVAITLDETNVENDGTPVTGEDAGRDKKNAYKLIPGHSYKKDPTVTVKAGSEESYIRMLVTIDKKAALDAIGFDMIEVFGGYDATKWVAVGNGTPGTEDNMVYEFRYFETVAAPGADDVLPALFTSLEVPGTITNAQLETLANLKIDIVAEAIQADGFDTADAAWTAFN